MRKKNKINQVYCLQLWHKNSIKWESHEDHKRTWQEVSNVLLSYLYYRYMVHAGDK